MNLTKIIEKNIDLVEDIEIKVSDLSEVDHPWSYDLCSCGCGETPDECNEDLSVKRKK